MSDYVVRALGANSEWIGMAAEVTDALKEAIALRGYDSSTASALGKMLLCAAMVGSALKDNNILSISLHSQKGDTRLIATANAKIDIKATANVDPEIGLVGPAILTVVRDLNLKTPYSGTVLTDFSTLDHGLELYFAQSEQILTRVKLHVSFGPNGELVRAFGYLLQALPFAKEDTKAKVFDSFDRMLFPEALEFRGYTPEQMLESMFSGLGENVVEKKPITWHCGCSKEKGAEILKSLGKEELESILAEGKTVHISCGFCGKKYYYTIDEIESLLASLEPSEVKEA